MKVFLLVLSLLPAALKADDQTKVTQLIYEASRLSGYEVPTDAALAIYTVEPLVMAAAACRGVQPCPTKAGYQDADVILLLGRQTPPDEEAALLHEIVHWLQHHSGRWPHMLSSTCELDYQREIEAYKASNRYIIEVQKRPATDQHTLPINRCMD